MSPVPADYTALSRFQLIFAFSLVTSLFFLWGLSYGLVDSLNSHFKEIFHLDYTQTTLLQFAYFISYLLVSPPMGVLMRRIGYKNGIHIGLGLFSTGCILFWPSAVYRQYGMFIAFTFVAASGIATLETAANTYIVVLGPAKYAAFRLTLAQAFNGIATVIGPQIASNTFFNGKNATELGTVQYVYLAVAVFALLLNIGFAFAKLPEVRQHVPEALERQAEEEGLRGLFKKQHMVWGFWAEFCYVGAQVAVASQCMFYIQKLPGINPPYSQQMASNFFSVGQAVFTIGRFFGVAYLRFVDPAFTLGVNGVGLILFSILCSTIPAHGGLACLMLVFFFESTCYPVIFAIATKDLGGFARVGGGIIAAGVSGGAWYPAAQAAFSDAHGPHGSYLVPMTGFVPLMIYGWVMWGLKCRRMGRWSIWQRDLDGRKEAVEDAASVMGTEGGLDEGIKPELAHDDDKDKMAHPSQHTTYRVDSRS